MGFLSSCNAESAISTCDSYNCNLVKTSKKNPSFQNPIDFSYSDLHASTDGFSQSHLLGKGSHGSVYRAHLKLNRRNLVAAVKKTKLTEPPTAGGTPADNEIEILSRVNHGRLVNLLGYSVDPNRNKLIVVEYMPNGSLYDLLHHSSGKPPGWCRRLRFALQIAKAVHFLHSSNPPVIHRDIKSSNILIDAHFNARLSDFGLALRGHVEDVRVSCTPPAGTLGYLDPGYLAPADLSTKSDVFSFGILLLEMISGRNAIDVNYSPPSVVDWAVPTIRSGDYAGICDPRIGSPDDETAMLQLAVLAARCVKSSTAKRPTMGEVVGSLKAVYRRIKNPIWNNIGRRVDCVRDSTRVVRYEPLDESTEMTKTHRVGIGSNRRNRKKSSVASVELGSDLIGGKFLDRVGRSRSIGSFSEIIECGSSSDFNAHNVVGIGGTRRRVGYAVKMPTVKLSKSRSTGMLQSSRMLNNNNNNNNNSTTISTANNNNNGVVTKLVKTPNGKELEVSKLLVDIRKETTTTSSTSSKEQLL